MRSRLAAGSYAVPAACMATVLDHFGRQLPLNELADQFGSASDVTPDDFAEVARSQGLDAVVRGFDPTDPGELTRPAIVKIADAWQVLLNVGANQVTVADPLRGVRKMSRTRFATSVNPIGIDFSATPELQRCKQPGPTQRLLGALPQSVTRGQIWVVLLALVAVVPVVVVPLLIRAFVDLFLVSGDSAVALQVLVGILLMAGLQMATLSAQNWALVSGGAAVDVTNILAILRGAMAAPARFLQERSAYDLAGRTTEIQVLGRLVSGQLARAIAGGLIFVAATVLMFILSPLLAVLSTGLLIVGILANQRLSQQALLSSQLGSIQRRQLRAETGLAVDNFETLKTLGHAHAVFDRFGDRLAAVKTTGIRDDIEWQRPFAGWFMFTIGTRLAVLVVGAQLVVLDRVSLGTLVAVQVLVGSQIQPLFDFVNAQQLMISARSVVVALEDVVDQTPQTGSTAGGQSRGDAQDLDIMTKSPVPEAIRATPKPSSNETLPSAFVNITDLEFGYEPRRPLTIAGVTLNVAPGRRVAIVGPSGSGKSTIARSIVGLIEPWAGDVQVGGVPISHWSPTVMANAVGYVSQDVTLVDGTVRDNITMMDSTITDDQVFRALADAQILADIKSRPGGLEHRIHDGGFGFSGGQIQRLGIARALVRDPRILVMDEATSALEPTTESLVDQAVRRRGCTTVIIAHRLSTVRDADEILVIDQGRIVEQGTHDQLVSTHGAYYRLVAQ